jgi:hypothetical protein
MHGFRNSPAKEKALKERRIGLRMWRHWRRERLETLLHGPYGGAVRTLLVLLKRSPKPATLLAAIRIGPWAEADADTRFEILALVDAAIVKRREISGLPPFDDALPFSDKPPNFFVVLRELLAPPPGAQPGLIKQTLSDQG